MKYGFTQLYRYFDKDNNLLYVGISFSAAVRASEHRRTSAWYSSAVKMTMENFDTRKECELAEQNAIRKEKPLHNITCTPRQNQHLRKDRFEKVDHGYPKFKREPLDRFSVLRDFDNLKDDEEVELYIASCILDIEETVMTKWVEKQKYGIKFDIDYSGNIVFKVGYIREITKYGLPLAG